MSGHLKKNPKKPRIEPSLRNHKHIAYQWCIEVGDEGKPHVHCWIAVNGSVINRTGLGETEHGVGYGMVNLIEKKWQRLTSGTLYLTDNGRTLTRTDRRMYEDCIYHYSYLSKTKGKYLPSAKKHFRNHGMSHLSRINEGCPIKYAHPDIDNEAHVYQSINLADRSVWYEGAPCTSIQNTTTSHVRRDNLILDNGYAYSHF